MEPKQTSFVDFLKRIEIFEGLSPYLLRCLSDRVQSHRFSKGTQILRKGDAGDCMFIIVSGQVNIPVTDDAGQLLYVSELGSGQIFGEMALLTGHPRASDVVAATDCQCLSLSKSIVEHLMRMNPDIAQMLTTILAERVKRAGGSQKVGKYALLQELARGSMAIVYDGLHPDLDRPLAIKMLHHELVYQPQFIERFRNEAKIVAHLRHPHIVEVFDLEEAYATFFIIMEKVKGIELHQAIKARGKISYTEARHILHQLLDALSFAHSQGVIHRDLKPSNIMIDMAGNVKLMDFGIALLPHSQDQPSEKNMLLGTPHFMAPEQHRCEAVDQRADIYAVGLIAYNMLKGMPPFNGRIEQIAEQKRKCKGLDIRKEDPHVPEDLYTLIRSTTGRDVKSRPKQAEELRKMLDPVDVSGFQISQMSAQTLTFVYPPHQQAAVRALLKKYKMHAEALPHVAAHQK